ncbi:MAG: helix-turn-helix transcriptional regulator [Tepidisphaera sp.]|jgi:lambda repressor-like predicted transcriptional regulator
MTRKLAASQIEAKLVRQSDHQDKIDALAQRVTMIINTIRTDGRSLRAVGQALGINRETLRRMSVGQCPSAELLIRLTEEFGVSAEWLLTGRGNQFRSDRVGHQIAS